MLKKANVPQIQAGKKKPYCFILRAEEDEVDGVLQSSKMQYDFMQSLMKASWA